MTVLTRRAGDADDLRRAARGDLARAVRLRVDLEVLPPAALGVELAATLGHRLERKELQDGADRVPLPELPRLRLAERLLHHALATENEEVLAFGLRTVGEAFEILGRGDELTPRRRRHHEGRDQQGDDDDSHGTALSFRSTRPGSAPVCSPSRMSTVPFTIVAS